jgi:hypothetical protein
VINRFTFGGLAMMRWILAAAFSLISAGQLSAQGKGIRFWNLTTATVSGFHLSPAGKNNWGPNQALNDKDGEVDHDERLRITGVAPGRYDARVSYHDNRQCMVRDIELKADAVFSIADKDLTDCHK